MRRLCFAAILLLSACVHGSSSGSAAAVRLSDKQALEIGKKIFVNEAGGKAEFLVHWNAGEEFASLGIGHFIWYPAGTQGPFDESFPKLLRFLSSRRTKLPAWLKGDPDCPWKSREQFLAEKESALALELRRLLEETIALQARFAADRLESALPKILAAAPEAEREALRRQFYRVAAHPNGVYALVDYVNFKGEGIKPTERYAGQGWGLLQVLQGMSGDAAGAPALDEFAESADRALTRRVENSPPERNEARWLGSWRKRLATYRAAS